MAINLKTQESAPLKAVRNSDQTITVTAGCQSFRLSVSDIEALTNARLAPASHHVNMLGTGTSWPAGTDTTTLVIGGLTPDLVSRLGLQPTHAAVEEALAGRKIIRVTLGPDGSVLDCGHNPDYFLSIHPTQL